METIEEKKHRLECEIEELEWKKNFLQDFIVRLEQITKQLQEDINAEKKKGFFSWFFD